MLSFLLKKFDNRNRKYLCIVFLIFFSNLTGCSPSIVRAGVMYGLVNGSYVPYSSLEIATNIYNYVSKDDVSIEEVTDNPQLINQLTKFIKGDYFDFKNIIINMCDDFYKVID